MQKIDDKLLDIIICPVSGGELIFDEDNNELISEDASLAYPVRDGIPILLESEARKI